MNLSTDTEKYEINLEQTADELKKQDNILIVTHCSPDGDTLGSAYALCGALQKLGKNVKVVCSDKIPVKYNYLEKTVKTAEFDFSFIVAVDLASENLFGEKYAYLTDKVDLCIDHHPSNSHYAKKLLLNAKAAATCEIIRNVILSLSVKIDNNIADCIYTGLATDSGCFRFSNTTPETLRCAADMVEAGADSAKINKMLFETVTPERMQIERDALNTLEYYCNRKAVLIYITQDMCKKAGVTEEDLEGIPSIPSRISGVLTGITIKEKSAGIFKISVRTNGSVNASEICAAFGGGGHSAAAGCQLEGSLELIKEKITQEVGKALSKLK